MRMLERYQTWREIRNLPNSKKMIQNNQVVQTQQTRETTYSHEEEKDRDIGDAYIALSIIDKMDKITR